MIRATDLSFWYPNVSKPALHQVTVEFSEGEIVLLAGPNGGGKSTLLKTLVGVLPTMIPGRLEGQVSINNQLVNTLTTTQLAGHIGIVLQDPESQISNLTVADEVNFGPANLCWEPSKILESAAAALERMEISHLRRMSVLALSGGQLQRLAIASLLGMQPEILVLDEPVTNLDPLGVASVMQAINLLKGRVKLMIISSHWLDPFIDQATRLLVMAEGEIVIDEPIEAIKTDLSRLPSYGVQIPQQWLLERRLAEQGIQLDMPNRHRWHLTPRQSPTLSYLPGIDLNRVSYQFGKHSPPTLECINLHIGVGERVALVGHNGTGKTTLARILAGLLKPQSGSIKRNISRVGMVLQKPSLGFLCNTVEEELAFGSNLTNAQIQNILEQFELGEYAQRSPFNLSGGEQRRLALAVALQGDPELLLLDESTAGLDSMQVSAFLELLLGFPGAVIHITHDTRIVGQEVETVTAIHRGRIMFHQPAAALSKEDMQHLGFDLINPTIKFASQWLDRGIPMLPNQVEVHHVGV